MSVDVEHECVEEVTERITLEEEIEQEQQDQDARFRGHDAFWTN